MMRQPQQRPAPLDILDRDRSNRATRFRTVPVEPSRQGHRQREARTRTALPSLSPWGRAIVVTLTTTAPKGTNRG